MTITKYRRINRHKVKWDQINEKKSNLFLMNDDRNLALSYFVFFLIVFAKLSFQKI